MMVSVLRVKLRSLLLHKMKRRRKKISLMLRLETKSRSMGIEAQSGGQ
jgi:hypothetical protein